MQLPISGLVLGLIAMTAVRANAQSNIVLVAQGKPQATIVTADNPTPQATQAAEVLRQYIEKITGAKLDICKESDQVSGSRVIVGHSKAVRALGVNAPSGFTNAMNEEGFVVKTVGKDLVLAGNEDWQYSGTLYAVYDLLGSLGCRWFFPGEFGEVVPRMDSLTVPATDRVERPDFRFRNIWYSGWMPVTPADSAAMSEWMLRNKLNSLSGLSLPGDGSIIRLAPPDKYFDSHPHIYATERKGERSKEMLCLTEPQAVEIAVKTITEAFRSDPTAVTFGFAPPDGHPMCYCERCQREIPGFTGKGYGEPSLSDAWFRFANKVATDVYKEFPDRWLFTNGYANRVRPPEGVGPLSPNLGIQSAMIDSCTLHPIGDARCWQRQTYKAVLDRWTDSLRCVFIYDYDPGKAIDGLPFPALHNLQRDFAYFRSRGIWGFWTEGNNSWMVTHLNYYVRGKLMWDADADVRAIVRDYCEKFYGPAASAVERYLWAIEDAVEESEAHETWGRLMPWRQILTPELMRELDARMAEAKQLAQESDVALHVRVLDMVHRHMKAFLAMEWAATRGDFAEAVLHNDAMRELRTEVGTIASGLLPHTPDWCRDSTGALEWYRKVYQDLAERVVGPKGELVAMLPQHWDFRKDPEDMGVVCQWYLPEAQGPWDMIDTTVYWEMQGHQDARGWAYGGKAWYRTGVYVPPIAGNRPVYLTIGAVYNKAVWIWVNGELVDHRAKQESKLPFDVDVTGHIRPGGMNCIAVLVDTLTPDRNARGGMHRRSFLWTPKS